MRVDVSDKVKHFCFHKHGMIMINRMFLSNIKIYLLCLILS